MAFRVQLTEHRTTSPAAIESDANRNVKTVNLKPAEGRLNSTAGRCDVMKEEGENNLVNGSQDFIMPDFHQLVVF